MDGSHLYEDKSLFKAHGPVWHQSDRQEGHIPEKLRHLDTDATWSKSGYHGWVYGYGLHLTCNHKGFPVLMQVETATYSEKKSLTHKETAILESLKPQTFCGDDAYTQAKRIRDWARQDVILLAPALRWRKGRYAQKVDAGNIESIQGNVLQLPFADDTFQLIVTCGVLEYVSLDEGLRELARVLKPGGRLVFIPVKPSFVGSVLELLYKFKIHPLENVERVSKRYFDVVGNHEFPTAEPIAWSKTIFLLEKR
jgi:hypothetical protein